MEHTLYQGSQKIGASAGRLIVTFKAGRTPQLAIQRVSDVIRLHTAPRMVPPVNNKIWYNCWIWNFTALLALCWRILYVTIQRQQTFLSLNACIESIKTDKLKTFFDAQPVHVVFVVDKVAQWSACLTTSFFLPVSLRTLARHSFLATESH
jgi:hypothetical protein